LGGHRHKRALLHERCSSGTTGTNSTPERSLALQMNGTDIDDVAKKRVTTVAKSGQTRS
jgi:hypothetical protein